MCPSSDWEWAAMAAVDKLRHPLHCRFKEQPEVHQPEYVPNLRLWWSWFRHRVRVTPHRLGRPWHPFCKIASIKWNKKSIGHCEMAAVAGHDIPMLGHRYTITYAYVCLALITQPGKDKLSFGICRCASNMATGFSSASVYKSQTPTGFRHQVFIMYHGTRAQNIESILDNGFRPSGGGTLGPGIYVSFDIKKAQAYGPVVFKLLVYVGKVCKIDRRGHPLQTSWQSNYGCAWITTNSGFALQVCNNYGYV